MEREVKFRSWDTKREQMYDEAGYQNSTDVLGPSINQLVELLRNEEDQILMQYTGRVAEWVTTTELNPEIYESDIIEVTWPDRMFGENCVVLFENGRWIVEEIKTKKKESLYHVLEHLEYAHTGTNIHETQS